MTGHDGGARTPALRRVDVWPDPMTWDAPWHAAPGTDAFLRSARTVCEVVDDALRSASAPLRSRATLLRLMAREDEGAPRGDAVELEVFTGPVDASGFDTAVVRVPAVVADLPLTARRLLVLEAVGTALHALAPSRGWDPDQVDDVRRRTLAVAPDLVHRWDGGWKSSPDRRLRARARYRVDDDGFGRARVQVETRDGAPVTTSVEVLAFHTREGLRRSARTLRWQSSRRVSLLPFSAPFGHEEGGLVLDLDAPDACVAHPDPSLARPAPTGTSPTPGVVVVEPPPWPVFSGGTDVDAVGEQPGPVDEWAWGTALSRTAVDPLGGSRGGPRRHARVSR